MPRLALGALAYSHPDLEPPALQVTPLAALRPVAAGESRLFFSSQPAARGAARIAFAAVLVSAAAFLAALPFATRQLAEVPAFVPAYVSALFISDLITSALLLSRFHTLRSRSLLVLASGYVFTALLAAAHALTFPGAFSPTGMLGAGPQSAAWLYLLWHSGFPIFVIGYALLEGEARRIPGDALLEKSDRGRPEVTIVASITAVLVLACLLTFAAISNLESLPTLVSHDRFLPPKTSAFAILVLPCVFALAALWRRRPRTILDLWLMVVMCVWAFDISLAAVFSSGRFDIGWYAGRIYGLFASSFLLIVLVAENGVHVARLARLSQKLTTANAALEHLSQHDALTGLANRRHFDEYLADQIAVAHRHKRALALVLCDVDEFKAFNTRHGHPAGDECLKRVAAALRSCCRRPADRAARYGGEEFALILPDTDLGGAVRIAEAARAAVARLRMPRGDGVPRPLASISAGVAVLRAVDVGAHQLITAADQALFQAKHLGRNRTVSVPAEPGYLVA